MTVVGLEAARRSGRARRAPTAAPAHVWAPGHLRVISLSLIVVLLAGAVWSRLLYWQVLHDGQLARDAQIEHQAVVVLPAVRGRIFDRNLDPVAVNNVAYSVFVSPDQIAPTERAHVAESLNGVLQLPVDQIDRVLTSQLKFAYVAHGVGEDQANRLRTLGLPGIGLEQDQVRAYMPGAESDSTLAANLLGFVGRDSNGNPIGEYGLEQYYNSELAGHDGSVSTLTDLAGNQIALGGQKRSDPVNGSDLVLTLDSSIQLAAEKAICDGVRSNHAESGSVVVMDPHTGGIVAWADCPTYDANQYAQGQLSSFMDPVASYLYEPGSVMKVVTLAGAIDSGAITPNTVINDPGRLYIGGYPIADFDDRSHGYVNYTSVLVNSLNVGAMKAEQAEGPQSFTHYLQSFGFAAPSGVDVAGEATDAQPLAQPLDKWHDSELATAAFGQGVAVNMLQMLAAVNVVANGGVYVRPHVVASIGGVPVSNPPSVRVIKPETAAAMTQMMVQVVQTGAPRLTAKVPGFDGQEAGKTGTSQMPENGKYSTDHVWASYVGFMPASNPKFIALVVIRKPDNGSWDHNDGYYAAAPIWKQIAEQIVVHWAMTPS